MYRRVIPYMHVKNPTSLLAKSREKSRWSGQTVQTGSYTRVTFIKLTFRRSSGHDHYENFQENFLKSGKTVSESHPPPPPPRCWALSDNFSGLAQNVMARAAVARLWAIIFCPPKQTPWRRPAYTLTYQGPVSFHKLGLRLIASLLNTQFVIELKLV